MFSKRVMADPYAGEAEDVEADPVADARRSPQVSPKRRLPVGSRRHEVESPACVRDTGTEAGHEVPALVFEGHRWHRDEDVIRQKCHQSVQVGGFPRVDELGHERNLAG